MNIHLCDCELSGDNHCDCAKEPTPLEMDALIEKCPEAVQSRIMCLSDACAMFEMHGHQKDNLIGAFIAWADKQGDFGTKKPGPKFYKAFRQYVEMFKNSTKRDNQ